MLKSVKRVTFASARRVGLFELVAGSAWRGRRLLILCYHSLARDDEHLWKPQLFMQPSLFRRRMELLHRNRAVVLPLQEGIRRLYAKDLPERSVALTFDDGTSDFYDLAYPVLAEFGFPATVYLTTYYCENPYPIFRLSSEYVLWKGRAQTLRMDQVTGEAADRALNTAEKRLVIVDELHDYARREGMSAEVRDQLVRRLAGALKFDYDAFLERRILQLMRPGEVSELAEAGVDFQLHTHRHRSPEEEELYRREIRQNRACLHKITGQIPRHFCYPSGRYRSEILPWLRDERVLSATTCRPGLVSPECEPLLLPRLVDSSSISAAEFEGWVAGAGAWLPRRSRRKRKPR